MEVLRSAQAAGRGAIVRVFVLVVAAACASCIRTVRTSTQMLAGPPPGAAVSTVMKRQVENAAYQGEGDVELRNLRQRLAANPSEVNARLQLATAYLQRGLPDLALEHYRLASAQFPDSVAVALTLAKTLRAMSAPEEALKTVRACSALHSSGQWELLSFEGILEDEQGQMVLAEASYRRAISVEPARASLHNNLGYNLLLQKKPQEAAVEFRRSLELDPRSATARNNLGEALAASNLAVSNHDALSELERAAPNDATAHNNLAVVLMEQGRYPEARMELTAALKEHPGFSEALQNLRLVSDHDGEPVTLPAHKEPVNFWSRVASTWDRLLGSEHDPSQPAAPVPPQRKTGNSGGSN